MRRQVVDHELAKILRVARGNPHQVVRDAGEMEDHQHARQRAYRVRERIDLLASMNGEPDRDERLERTAERREIDLGVEALDDALLAERAQAGESGGGRDADALGQ